MQKTFAEIITVGDELLNGHIPNTNAQWLSKSLTGIGSTVVRTTTVGDQVEAMVEALTNAANRATIILLTGGLGPTKDDCTRTALSRYTHRPLVLYEQALADTRAIFQYRGLAMSPADERQAYLLTGCTIIRNELGTASGIWLAHQGKVIIALPGVPDEMQQMMAKIVLPRLQEQFELPVIFHKHIHTVGIVESWLADQLQAWEQKLPSYMKLAYLPQVGTVTLRLTATGAKEAPLEQEVEAQIQQLLPLIGPYIYGYDRDTLPGVVGRLLKAQDKYVALAESCSGGHASQVITQEPGCSAYYKGSIVAYHTAAKTSLLGVDPKLLTQHGVVSAATAEEMAQQVREKFQSNFGLASTGIAGPGGGSTENPVGTVWIALADGHTTCTQKLQLSTSRWKNIQLTTIALLDLLRKVLLQPTN